MTAAEPVAAPELVLRGVCYAYPDGTPGLDGIDLEVAAGERVALLGPNGAGKSTLLLQINGLLRGEGVIEVRGQRLEDSSLAAIRAQVGLLFSNPDDQLFSPTVLDDVAYGPLHQGLVENEVLRRARAALAEVGMSGYEARTPHRLSLGEKKRIAIATVLSMRPAILALDEPAASLAPAARADLVALLRGLPQTQLIATHDLGLVRDLATRAVVLEAGRIVADGAAGRDPRRRGAAARARAGDRRRDARGLRRGAHAPPPSVAPAAAAEVEPGHGPRLERERAEQPDRRLDAPELQQPAGRRRVGQRERADDPHREVGAHAARRLPQRLPALVHRCHGAPSLHASRL